MLVFKRLFKRWGEANCSLQFWQLTANPKPLCIWLGKDYSYSKQTARDQSHELGQFWSRNREFSH